MGSNPDKSANSHSDQTPSSSRPPPSPTNTSESARSDSDHHPRSAALPTRSTPPRARSSSKNQPPSQSHPPTPPSRFPPPQNYPLLILPAPHPPPITMTPMPAERHDCLQECLDIDSYFGGPKEDKRFKGIVKRALDGDALAGDALLARARRQMQSIDLTQAHPINLDFFTVALQHRQVDINAFDVEAISLKQLLHFFPFANPDSANKKQICILL